MQVGLVMVVYIVFFIALIYFMSIRPNKKKQNEKQLMLSKIETGDSVLTTSGFYGVVIGIEEEIVVLEFGNNKNCRIPVRKEAILDVEKQNEVVETKEKK